MLVVFTPHWRPRTARSSAATRTNQQLQPNAAATVPAPLQTWSFTPILSPAGWPSLFLNPWSECFIYKIFICNIWCEVTGLSEVVCELFTVLCRLFVALCVYRPLNFHRDEGFSLKLKQSVVQPVWRVCISATINIRSLFSSKRNTFSPKSQRLHVINMTVKLKNVIKTPRRWQQVGWWHTSRYQTASCVRKPNCR